MNSLFDINSEEQFRNAAKEVLNTLYSSKSAMRLENNMITQAKEELKQIIASNNFDLTKVQHDLQNKGLNSDRINWFLNILEEMSSELLYSSLLYHNSMFEEAVVNFDWNLKIVLGTSELKTLRYPLLQLLLKTNDQRQKIYEMNKDMLKKFIDVLESV